MSQCAECGCQAADGWALYCLKCSESHTKPETKRLQELTAKTSDMEAEIKRLQEREWQGLTNADYKVLEIETLANNMSYREVLMWADKRLKEKNHVS
jgi:hypothetical protein